MMIFVMLALGMKASKDNSKSFQGEISDRCSNNTTANSCHNTKKNTYQHLPKKVMSKKKHLHFSIIFAYLSFICMPIFNTSHVANPACDNSPWLVKSPAWSNTSWLMRFRMFTKQTVSVGKQQQEKTLYPP